ncbi:hypothetical protein C0993_006427 [Termitomyces sp. T159_Od127]|nr:hypothetical protein C0993_006427 [Termitomyces sp. T159_Od127]
MSELAASLRGEIQGLVVEIKQLKREREGLFRSLFAPNFRPSLPLFHRKRSTQTLWLPTTPTPPASEDHTTDKVEMGLFGPRSRVPSIIDSPSPAAAPDQVGLDSGNNASASASQLSSQSSARQHPFRSTSEASQSSNNFDVPTTPKRTAWRVVEKKPAPVHVTRTGIATS